MAGKSARREMLEKALQEAPEDSFLRYGLAVQCLRDGDIEEGRRRLRELAGEAVPEAVAAWQQLGQSYAESEEWEAARAALEEGIAAARCRGDHHAAEEMAALRDQLGP